jgi:hypothetical protein
MLQAVRVVRSTVPINRSTAAVRPAHEPVDEVLFDSAQDLLGYHERIGSPAFKLDKSNPPETAESSAAGPDQATGTAASAAIAAAPFGTPSPVQAFQPAAAS